MIYLKIQNVTRNDAVQNFAKNPCTNCKLLMTSGVFRVQCLNSKKFYPKLCYVYLKKKRERN